MDRVAYSSQQKGLKPNVKGNPLHFIAFGFGSGLLPGAPGTYGTVVGAGLYLLLQPLGWMWYGIITILLILMSIWLSEKVSQDIQVHDHPGMNIDEIVGFLVVMFLVPNTWLALLLGFLYFRLFDIWKPWPIGWVDEHVSGGLGMILDDVLAAIVANVVTQLSLWLVF